MLLKPIPNHRLTLVYTLKLSRVPHYISSIIKKIIATNNIIQMHSMQQLSISNGTHIASLTVNRNSLSLEYGT